MPVSLRKAVVFFAFLAVVGASVGLDAQGDPKAALEQKLKEAFPLTKFSADKSEVVTAGAVVVLQKDKLMTYAVASPMPPINTYKNGKISQGLGGFTRDILITTATGGGGTANDYPHQQYVTGQTLWVGQIAVSKDNISLVLLSDPDANNVRYYGQLNIPFHKGSIPSPDEGLRAVSEVLTVQQPQDNGGSQGDQSQNGDTKAAILEAIKAQFIQTKLSEDLHDIVTPGTIITLRSQDGILLCSTVSKVPLTSYYEEGHISLGPAGKAIWNRLLNAAQPGVNSTNIPQRKFMPGDKLWVTGYAVFKDGFILQFYSDPYDGSRYFGQLKFMYPGGTPPSPDQAMSAISEALTVGGGNQNSASTALPPLPPPPPPTDAPPATPTAPAAPRTIALGQTKDQVVANFGQPQKVAHVGAKEIDYYPDIKVTFVNGKVTGVE